LARDAPLAEFLYYGREPPLGFVKLGRASR
jgi:hypothetical protein